MIKNQVSKEDMIEYGDFFRFMRRSVNLTIKEMAQLLGNNVATSSLSKWERGQIPAEHDVKELEMKVRKIVLNIIQEKKMRVVS